MLKIGFFIVVESADAHILGGIPFGKRNGIEMCLLKEEIYIRREL